jgi:hypothetical protein
MLPEIRQSEYLYNIPKFELDMTLVFRKPNPTP